MNPLRLPTKHIATARELYKIIETACAKHNGLISFNPKEQLFVYKILEKDNDYKVVFSSSEINVIDVNTKTDEDIAVSFIIKLQQQLNRFYSESKNNILTSLDAKKTFSSILYDEQGNNVLNFNFHPSHDECETTTDIERDENFIRDVSRGKTPSHKTPSFTALKIISQITLALDFPKWQELNAEYKLPITRDMCITHLALQRHVENASHNVFKFHMEDKDVETFLRLAVLYNNNTLFDSLYSQCKMSNSEILLNTIELNPDEYTLNRMLEDTTINQQYIMHAYIKANNVNAQRLYKKYDFINVDSVVDKMAYQLSHDMTNEVIENLLNHKLNDNQNTVILTTALQNNNYEVAKFIMDYCTYTLDVFKNWYHEQPDDLQHEYKMMYDYIVARG